MSDDIDDRRDRDDWRTDRDRPNSHDASDRRDAAELDERVAELEERVRKLRTELGRPPEGPLGLPRPPTPREVLSFTGEYAIPTAIAVLEANVRALEALQQVVRVLDPERSVVSEERDRLETRVADASRTTLDRLENALEDVESTIRESDLPREGEARDVLEDARRINREIRDRVDTERRRVDESRERAREPDRDANRGRTEHDDAERGRPDDDEELDAGTTIELVDEGADREDGDSKTDDSETSDEDSKTDGDERADDPAEVDVEAELRSIRDELEDRNQTNASDRRDAEAGETDDANRDDADTGSGNPDGDDSDHNGGDADGSDTDGSNTGGGDADADGGDNADGADSDGDADE